MCGNIGCSPWFVCIPCRNASPGLDIYQMRVATSHNGISHTGEVRPVLWQDLTLLIQQYQEEQYDIIVGLDANSDCDNPRSEISQFAEENNLIDFYSHFQGGELSSTENGSKLIDTILVSTRIINTIQRILFLPYDTLDYSDHRALILDLNKNVLMKHHTRNPISPILDDYT